MSTHDTTKFKKTLYGWLSYAFASEVFVIVSLTLFLPVALEALARDHGYMYPDHTKPCNSAHTQAEPTNNRCSVKIGWLWIDSASFSLYINSLSVALQAISVISVGGIADHSVRRKRLLLCFAALGFTSSALFLALPSTSPIWYLCALLAVCANVGFGVSTVAMNAYLPSLAKDSPEIVKLRDELEASRTDSNTATSNTAHSAEDEEPLIQHTDTLEPSSDLQKEYETQLSRATARISSQGIALGYGAGIFLLIMALIPVTLLKGSLFSLRLAIGLSGIWWAAFSIPAALWLPGADAPIDFETATWVEHSDAEEGLSVKREVVAAWKRLGKMLHPREVRKLKNTFQYLAAWFLLSDGFTTLTSTAILFAKTALNMSPSSLIVIGVLSPLSGILGSILWPRLQRKFGWTNLKVLIILVILTSMIPLYGCLGFLIQGRFKFGGLTSPGEMYGLAVFFGSFYGAFQGYARAFYAELVPPGEEARWFGLYSITDKSSSFLGPLVVGLISDLTGNIRYSMFFLVAMIWLAVPILASVAVEQGKRDARAYRSGRS